jgi:uncharacterized protein (TIGR02001 family)
MQTLRKIVPLAAAAALFAGAGSPASAGDFASMFDVAFGVAVTSNYVARGITQTDDKPAVQGYVEGSLGKFYAGAWTSNVSFGGVTDQEVDLYVGFRPEIDKFASDFGYAYYLYTSNPAGTGYGEIYGKVDATVTENLTLGAAAYYAPDWAQTMTSASYVEVNGALTLPHNFAVNALLGYQSLDPTVGTSYLTWGAGISWNPIEPVTLAVNYTGTDLSPGNCLAMMNATTDCASKVMFSLSLDTSLKALKEMGKGS